MSEDFREGSKLGPESKLVAGHADTTRAEFQHCVKSDIYASMVMQKSVLQGLSVVYDEPEVHVRRRMLDELSKE